MDFRVEIDRADLQAIERDQLAKAKRGLYKAAVHVEATVKTLLSTPAPRKRVLGKRGQMQGVYYYRATAPATPGAPPRKLSGRLRSSITREISNGGLRAVIGTNAVQAPRLEELNHGFLSVVTATESDRVQQIIADEMGR